MKVNGLDWDIKKKKNRTHLDPNIVPESIKTDGGLNNNLHGPFNHNKIIQNI